MSDTVIKLLAGIGCAVLAVGLSLRFGVGLARELAVAAARAIVQLAVVGALLALIFRYQPLALIFVAVMTVTAGLTAGRRLRPLPGARARALVAIAVPALGITAALLAVGAFPLSARAAIPTAGILIGGALAATTLTGRRLLEAVRDGEDGIEARLALGDGVRQALAPAIRGAIETGLVPVIDQTRSVGLVTLPGTFVGLILGGASPEEAAVTQLVVLLALLAVELGAALAIAELITRALRRPGERVAFDAVSR